MLYGKLAQHFSHIFSVGYFGKLLKVSVVQLSCKHKLFDHVLFKTKDHLWSRCGSGKNLVKKIYITWMFFKL